MQEAALDSRDVAVASVEKFETIVIGAGQAGLAVGYHLQKRGRPFVILDANDRVGGSWRTRTWSSLRLFTPARYDGLPGWGFPAPAWSYPTARETADYLEADSVVVAPGFYGKPSVPGFASELDPRIVQMHSSDYRDPSMLRPGGVLLVGAGNSGADIAMELSATHATWLSGPDKGQVPIRIESPLRRVVLPVLWFIASRVLTTKTPIGRKVRPHVLASGAPRIRVKTKDLTEAGVESVPRTVEVRNGLPVLEDGRVMDVANVIWCTGFRQDFSWIDVPVFGEHREPIHKRGVASEPGLYFVGLDFLHAFTSENVGGVGRDARHIAGHIASR
ncbi:MAG: NAD(P)/FAD-dependent oxidoreductase [Actinomycetota bacterium]|nr:NAD(P)/FAD-dependent oxidoreductase [Actinomycetota bacterium]